MTGGEGRDFGPSQCWKQIDAPVHFCDCEVSVGYTIVNFYLNYVAAVHYGTL